MQPLSWNLVNVDLIWNNAMQWKVVQCSWHSFPILWFWFWFNFFGKHRLTVLLKKAIIHATLSYLFKSLRELPQSVCSVWVTSVGCVCNSILVLILPEISVSIVLWKRQFWQEAYLLPLLFVMLHDFQKLNALLVVSYLD